MKKQALLFVLLGSLVLTGCGNAQSSKEEGPKADFDLGEKEIHTDLMKQYLNDPDWESIKTYVPVVNAEDSSYHNDQSQPNPIELKFEEVADADKYVVEIAKTLDFTNAKKVEATAKTYNFYNAEIGQDYYYRAAASEIT